jgi:UDP:flavonoid glycosyltransferase YjiC (YdhE family)
MLVVPFGQDQPDNARRCVRLGVARSITRRQYTPSRIAREISQLLDDPGYASRARELGKVIEAEQGTSVACDALEAVLRGD